MSGIVAQKKTFKRNKTIGVTHDILGHQSKICKRISSATFF